MSYLFRRLLSIIVFALPVTGLAVETIDSVEEIGRSLFFDKNLSKSRSQACATCHVPEFGFVDPRYNNSGKALSLGEDGRSFGSRNAPTLSYAAFTPDFSLTKEGHYIGGQFYDGREKDLVSQAKMPILTATEMGMPSKESVIARLQENPDYIVAFKRFYGENIFEDSNLAYNVMTNSIAAFERTELFAPFDSKYDRHLRGEYTMTSLEELGMTLFFSQQFTNCNICHQLKPTPNQEGETFSNYQYHNIGVPANKKARHLNGMADGHIDRGLLDNPAVDDAKQAGKFKVPTLRNVAVTSPYMHNGVFKDLPTVVKFYNKYNSKSLKQQVNPETGEHWQQPEVAENLSLKELETGPSLEEKRINALVAFMKTLTDRKYEHLIFEE